MKIREDNPSALTALDRPNSYIGRSVPRPNLRDSRKAARNSSATWCCRAWRTSLSCARRTRMRASRRIDAAAAKKAPGVIAVVTGAELAKVITPWVGVLTHLKGIKSAPQHAIAVDRARWQGEAVCAVVARTRAEAEDALRTGRGRIRGAPAVTDAETALDAGTPVIHPELGDNLCFERVHRRRRSRQGLRGRRRGGRAHLRVRPPHRRLQRAARHRRRLEPRRAAAHRLSRHAGAAHDAEPVRQAPRPRGASGARGHQGRRRLVRHQGAHLRRRDGDGRAVQAAQAAGQIRRRPDRELRHRHPRPRPSREGEDRRKNDGTITAWEIDDLTGIGPYSVYPRTSRHRGEPGRQPHRRALHLPELPGARPRRVHEQERDVPVPRGRPSDRDRGDRRPGRARGAEDRHGPAGNPAAQSHPRRRPSVAGPVRHQVRGAVAPFGARASRRDDELRRAARRAGGAAQEGHLSRHRLCQLHRGDQSVARRSTASAARASRRRTAPPCGSTPPARSSATPASPSRARAPKP